MHKTVVIICDGQFPKSEYPRYLIRTADFIICCDGALRKFLKNSRTIFGEERLPDLVIGDMDTLPASQASLAMVRLFMILDTFRNLSILIAYSPFW